MNLSYKHVLPYTAAAAAYGLGRKVYQMWDAKTYDLTYDSHKKEFLEIAKPVLFADKVAVCAFTTLLSPAYFPMYVYNDIRWLEVKMKGLNLEDYTYTYNVKPRSTYHYLFK